eukprot:7383718-Prymnesium_polylepis.1
MIMKPQPTVLVNISTVALRGVGTPQHVNRLPTFAGKRVNFQHQKLQQPRPPSRHAARAPHSPARASI